ncbi:response regulator receiver protein [Maricaulis maris MCS10]|jgi:CheY-like chemotaxis protein|uniref:Response regulator receiver protein n=1 Tax=Maricaulis maris (strain MCS10) TaxID=394221 RepID=Q0ALM5_MARMM|nr:response regulator [Maricaulis maris]ABI66818.1 response regulator receiver protein [Maricaulis maris MCS10]
MNMPRPARILLVEDNSGDEFLVRDAFERGRARHQLEVVRDGEAALDRLRGLGEHSEKQAPDLILLDLNLPKIDGRDVLKSVKTDKALASIPVLVLTTSSAQSDVTGCYSLHANAYLTKPFDALGYEEIVEAVENFWFATAVLPSQNPAPH